MDIYEKKYKEALESARQEYNTTENVERKQWLEDLFPELAESENERIRKAIHIYLDWLDGRNKDCQPKGEYTIRDMIAWLEKQGEQEPTDEEMKTLLRTEYEKGRADAIAEMQNPAWGEEDEEMWLSAIEYVRTYPAHTNSVVDWLKSLKDRVQLQSKQEWSEDDETHINGIIDYLCDYKLSVNEEDINVANGVQEEIDWLKSLKPQNMCVYNPYKAVVESIAEMCKHYDKASHSGLRDFYDNVKVKCKDAKEYDSLYPQNCWKPSDVQMKALKYVAYHLMPDNNYREEMFSLYEQLKKLKEE